MTSKQIIVPRPETDRSQPSELTVDSGKLFNIALEIAKERSEKLKLLKAAILKEDTKAVYRLAASLCGLGDNYEVSNRTH